MAEFYLDNDVSLGLVPLLEARGHPVASARALGLTRAGDHAQLLVAVRRQAILVTYNLKDFVLLHDAWRTWPAELQSQFPPHAGILALDHAPVSEQIAAIDDLLDGVPPSTVRNEMFSWRREHGWRRRMVGQGWNTRGR